MNRRFSEYTVYVFPNGHKRLAFNLAALTLNQLTSKYGKPTKTTYSYERVIEEGIK